ncbi:alpha/beta hydrolase [Amycolatopsis sp. CA-126428]|uniref:alpha/beta hydrolase n=1 Tax=Amycolatopsis sp. CA-126428 TaxID=2073158 RepID=UPI000CD02304|nr:alpha/beta hydrolase [Amycolatopsis sp. CA-126428]
MTVTHDFETHHTTGGSGLALDVFRPSAGSRRCAVVVLHGGGWRSGSRELVHTRAAALAAHGFTAVAAQYRLLDVAAWPAALSDVAEACSWVRESADTLEIAPDYLVVQGHSAGAHLALMAGTFDAELRPAAVVAYYPAIGFHDVPAPAAGSLSLPLEMDDVGRVPSWMLFPAGAGQADLRAASPIDLMQKDFPPTIIQHGTADKAIDARSSMALHQRLADLGVPADLHLYSGQNHEFDRAPSMTTTTVSATVAFLERFVTDRERQTAEAQRFPFPPSPDA